MSKKGGKGGSSAVQKCHCKFTQVKDIYEKNAIKFSKVRGGGVKGRLDFCKKTLKFLDNGHPLTLAMKSLKVSV